MGWTKRRTRMKMKKRSSTTLLNTRSVLAVKSSSTSKSASRTLVAEPYEHIRDPPSPTLHPRLLLQQLLADRMDRKEERKITKYGRCHYVDPTSFLKTFLSHFFFFSYF